MKHFFFPCKMSDCLNHFNKALPLTAISGFSNGPQSHSVRKDFDNTADSADPLNYRLYILNILQCTRKKMCYSLSIPYVSWKNETCEWASEFHFPLCLCLTGIFHGVCHHINTVLFSPFDDWNVTVAFAMCQISGFKLHCAGGQSSKHTLGHGSNRINIYWTR